MHVKYTDVKIQIDLLRGVFKSTVLSECYYFSIFSLET